MSYHYSIKKAMDDSSLRLKRERERERERETETERETERDREREIQIHFCIATVTYDVISTHHYSSIGLFMLFACVPFTL